MFIKILKLFIFLNKIIDIMMKNIYITILIKPIPISNEFK